MSQSHPVIQEKAAMAAHLGKKGDGQAIGKSYHSRV